MSALLAPGAQPLTMTSREISELTGKRHPDVKRDIEKMLADLSEDVSKFARIYLDSMNREQTEYSLDRELTETLLTGYSAVLRRRVIARWRELEAGASPALNLRQPAQLLAVAMQLAEVCQEQQAQLAAQAPKVAFAEAVGASGDLQSVGEVAKAIGTGQHRLFAFMRENGILMVNNLPYQHHIDVGRFKVVERPWKDADGNDRLRLQTMVTGKGVTFLQQRLTKAKALVDAELASQAMA